MISAGITRPALIFGAPFVTGVPVVTSGYAAGPVIAPIDMSAKAEGQEAEGAESAIGRQMDSQTVFVPVGKDKSPVHGRGTAPNLSRPGSGPDNVALKPSKENAKPAAGDEIINRARALEAQGQFDKAEAAYLSACEESELFLKPEFRAAGVRAAAEKAIARHGEAARFYLRHEKFGKYSGMLAKQRELAKRHLNNREIAALIDAQIKEIQSVRFAAARAGQFPEGAMMTRQLNMLRIEERVFRTGSGGQRELF